MRDKLPTDPDELAAFIRERAIEIENDLSGVHARAWDTYLRTIAEFGIDDSDSANKDYGIRMAAQTQPAPVT